MNSTTGETSSFTLKYPAITRKEILLAMASAFLLFVVLLLELAAPGVTWDEVTPNFPAAKNQAYWISHLFSLDSPFSQETIDQYWYTRSDHPSLPRTIAAISYLVFGSFVDEVVALRIPSALKFSLLLVSLYFFLRIRLPQVSALAGALSLALMPRVFGHAHLFSLDLPITCWWFWAAMTGYLVMQGWVRPICFGVVYGLAFTTKLHSVFLPFPFAAWVLWEIIMVQKNNKEAWRRLGWLVLWVAILTPLIYVALQPWLWHDTGTRIVERFFDYAGKTPIPLYYLGVTYQGDTPWHYPLVMLLFTLPAPLLLLGIVGLAAPLLSYREQAENKTGEGWIEVEKGNEVASLSQRERGWTVSFYIFLLLHFLTPLSLFILPLAEAYDGVRLFLPCFPFAACLIGLGFHFVRSFLIKKVKPIYAYTLLFVFLVLPPLWSLLQIRPFYLAYYNEVAGGVSGAYEWGMESTYWCDAITRDFLQVVNDKVPPGKKILPFSMPFELMDYYKSRGWLRENIQYAGDPPYDYFLLHCRQGMFRRTPEWAIYRTMIPLAAVEVDGVPLVALYPGGL